ncbi:hypothetical protein GCM10023221_13210 [Luteimicrobium xylanilyticum]|uniref:Zinc import ATP-binding protein ZnuC n=1 Tax=Luteimicrobium xylanilyticum TaxID=1133546 RepID=A0A5P9QCV0_9MICO|nr:heme ABC transporter ATP-binding protein [Luteimicrobium xylanilyticum]QFU99207.1 Zinc import ATP-binding protein ZnuC [Luteimicrobium xylanilyticum]
MSAIEARGVTVALAGRDVVQDVDLVAAHGEVLGLVGPNGAGKSTLLRALSGAVPTSAGHVLVDGDDLAGLPVREVARRVAVVPQDTVVPADLPVLDVVLLGRYAHRRRLARATEADDDVALAALRTVGLEPLARRSVARLSGGERQLVHLARALAQQARTLLLDEPTAALDVSHQLRVLRLVRNLADGGTAVVVVLHDLDQAARWCDRIAILDRGRLAALGAVSEVLTPDVIARVYGVRALVRHEPALHAPHVLLLDLLAETSADPARPAGPSSPSHQHDDEGSRPR